LQKAAVELGLPENNFINAVQLIGQGDPGSTGRKFYCEKFEAKYGA